MAKLFVMVPKHVVKEGCSTNWFAAADDESIRQTTRYGIVRFPIDLMTYMCFCCLLGRRIQLQSVSFMVRTRASAVYCAYSVDNEPYY